MKRSLDDIIPAITSHKAGLKRVLLAANESDCPITQIAITDLLGVVEETTRRPMPEVNAFFEKLEGLFAKEDFTKAQVVEAIKEFIPNFEHEEKGKNLDQKM